MKATILNGALSGDEEVDGAGQLIASDLRSRGWQVENLSLREMDVAYCLGCFQCWTHTPGLCRIDDEGQTIAEHVIQSDMVVLLTAVTFGGYSSELKKALDRIICLLSPFFMRIQGEVHHRKRYERYPAMWGVGIQTYQDSAQAETFTRLVERNAINFHAPVQAAHVLQPDLEPTILTSALQTFIEANTVIA